MPNPPPAQIDPATPFADEVRAFLGENAIVGRASDAVVFFGSSSIRLWNTLARDFAGIRVINRGFGGSSLVDAVREFERTVVPLAPRALVIYSGDNDLDQGGTPEQVLWNFEKLIGAARERLGGIPLLFLAIKPSPIRFWNHPQIRRANELLRDTCARRGILFVDSYTPMLNEHGTPRRELFGEDGLHLSAAGYAVWTNLLRPLLPSAG